MNRKGFTLVELLAVIILLSILSSIAIFLVGDVIKSSKEKLTDTQIKNIEEAAKSYYLEEGIDDEVYTLDNTKSCVNLSYLIDNGYINDDKIRLLVDNKEINGSVNIIYKANQYSYEYNEEVCKNVMPNVIKTILNDNPLQEEVEGMFNYTSEGGITDKWNYSTGYLLDEIDENYVTNGLYSTEDDDGISYYFRGNVNNIVQFGTYQTDYYVYNYHGHDFQTLESCYSYSYSDCSESNKTLKYAAGTPMYWRIVRVNGDGTLRLVYSGIVVDAKGEELTIGYSEYNTKESDIKYGGYTYDNGVDSLVKSEVETWYKNAFSTSSYDNYIAEGKFCSDSSGYGYSSYDLENNKKFAGFDRVNNGTPTLKCPVTNQTFGGSYNLKAGLLTVDEFMFAGSKYLVFSNNYLSSGTTKSDQSVNYWSMSLAYIYLSGPSVSPFTSTGRIGHSYATSEGYVRPVINVDVTDLTISGSGSVDDPYILIPKQN